MNAVRCGLVCLSLGALLGLAHLVPEGRRAARADDEQSNRDAVWRRILAKDMLGKDLVAGRRSLPEVAALFRELDRTPPAAVYPSDPDPDPPLRLHTPTDDERYCVVVIAFVRNVLRVHRPDRAEAVTEQLVAEFEAERRAAGTIRLPAPDSLVSVPELLRRCVADEK